MIGGVGVGGYERKETIRKLALASLYYSVVLQDCYLSDDYSQLNFRDALQEIIDFDF